MINLFRFNAPNIYDSSCHLPCFLACHSECQILFCVRRNCLVAVELIGTSDHWRTEHGVG